MKNFLIGGEIVDDSAQAWAFEDVTPSQVRAFLAKVEDGEEVVFEISSPGGSVVGGTAICNLIKDACKRGVKTKAHVIGLAASMASAIACACDEVEIDDNAFMMIHNPWTQTSGDAEDLRKSADLLDKIKKCIISVYRSKFDKTDEELSSLMDEETWFTGSEAEAFGFKATVLPSAELKVAACARSVRDFARIPDAARTLLALGKPLAEETPAEPVTEPAPVEETPAEPVTEPAPVEETPAEPPAELAPETPEGTAALAEEIVTLAECERRVSGMQSAMAKQLDAVRAECASARKDFDLQLAKVNEELIKARAEITNLTTRAETAEMELQKTASDLKAKTEALATLNARVNSSAKMEETFDYSVALAQAHTAEEKLAAAIKASKLNSKKGS